MTCSSLHGVKETNSKHTLSALSLPVQQGFSMQNKIIWMFIATGRHRSHIRNLECFYLRTLDKNKNGGSLASNIWLLPVHELTWRLTSDWIVPTALSNDGCCNGGPTLLALSFSSGLNCFIKKLQKQLPGCVQNPAEVRNKEEFNSNYGIGISLNMSSIVNILL